jgi:hypothetical protein
VDAIEKVESRDRVAVCYFLPRPKSEWLDSNVKQEKEVVWVVRVVR